MIVFWCSLSIGIFCQAVWFNKQYMLLPQNLHINHKTKTLNKIMIVFWCILISGMFCLAVKFCQMKYFGALKFYIRMIRLHDLKNNDDILVYFLQ